jgi:putative copper export protein
MQEGWRGVAHRVNDALHVLSGGAWLGALVPLVPILAALNYPKQRKAAEFFGATDHRRQFILRHDQFFFYGARLHKA